MNNPILWEYHSTNKYGTEAAGTLLTSSCELLTQGSGSVGDGKPKYALTRCRAETTMVGTSLYCTCALCLFTILVSNWMSILVGRGYGIGCIAFAILLLSLLFIAYIQYTQCRSTSTIDHTCIVSCLSKLGVSTGPFWLKRCRSGPSWPFGQLACARWEKNSCDSMISLSLSLSRCLLQVTRHKIAWSAAKISLRNQAIPRNSWGNFMGFALFLPCLGLLTFVASHGTPRLLIVASSAVEAVKLTASAKPCFL